MNIHFGKGEVVAQDGQPLGNGRMHPKTRNMMVISKLWRLYWEEQIRTISRKDFAQAYGILECTETSKHSLLKYAIDNYSSSPPSGSTSTLAWKLLGLDWDDVDNRQKQYVTEVRKKQDFDSSDFLEMLRMSQRRESIQDLRTKSDSPQVTNPVPAPDSKAFVSDGKMNSNRESERKENIDFDSIDILDMLKKDQLRESIQAAVAKALNHSLKERTPKASYNSNRETKCM